MHEVRFVMAMVIPLTVAGNIFALIMLLFNDHYTRHGALTLCCVYSVLADPALQQICLHMSATAYLRALAGREFIVIMLMLFIIAEAWQAGKLQVRRPVEIQLA